MGNDRVKSMEGRAVLIGVAGGGLLWLSCTQEMKQY